MKKYLPNYSAVVAGFFLICASLVLDSGEAKANVSPKLTDRLVLAVGGASYSERHVIVWMILRELMQEISVGEPSSTVKNLKARPSYLLELKNNWPAVLEKFNEDMLIKLESSRLGSSAPSERTVVTIAERVERHRKQLSELNAAMIKLRVNEEEKMQFIANIVQVESFRATREKQRPSIGRGASVVASGGGDFVAGLKVRYSSRRYDGASEPGKVLDIVLNSVLP